MSIVAFVHFCEEQFRGAYCYGVNFCGSIVAEFIIARSIVSEYIVANSFVVKSFVRVFSCGVHCAESIVTGSNVAGYIVARFIDPGSIV